MEIRTLFKNSSHNFTDMVPMSVGYRRLYYDVDGDRGEFDGSLHGALLGFGFKF